MRIAALLCLSSAISFGQVPNVSQPTNLDFSQGGIGQTPSGWEIPNASLVAGFRAEIRQEGCGRFAVCVAYVAPAVIGNVHNANLGQTFPADRYVGKWVRFSAWLRTDQVKEGGYIHIRIRVYYADGHSELEDSAEPPVTGPEWQHRSVFAHVGKGASTIAIWARYVTPGSAQVAAASFEVTEESRFSFATATGGFAVKAAAGHSVRFGAWIKTENVREGYAGLWWRVDGEGGKVLSFDNSETHTVNGKAESDDGTVRGAAGSTDWTWHEIELPVPEGARNINFGFLMTGIGGAWFDAARIELDGAPYFSPDFDLDFESPRVKGFSTAADTRMSRHYRIVLDKQIAFHGVQSLKIESIGSSPPSPPATSGPRIKILDPAEVDDSSKSLDYATRAPITFVNRRSGAVDIYWIDYQGDRVLKRANLSGGQSWRTETFLTHPWLVVAAGTGGTTEHGTGWRIAAFEVVSAAGGEAILTDR